MFEHKENSSLKYAAEILVCMWMGGWVCVHASMYMFVCVGDSALVMVLWQMIRKSVEARDWLNTIEPRSVRSVMKRVVEEITVIDKQVASLYKEGSRKDQGSGKDTGGGHAAMFKLISEEKYGMCVCMCVSSLQSWIRDLCAMKPTSFVENLLFSAPVLKIILSNIGIDFEGTGRIYTIKCE